MRWRIYDAQVQRHPVDADIEEAANQEPKEGGNLSPDQYERLKREGVLSGRMVENRPPLAQAVFFVPCRYTAAMLRLRVLSMMCPTPAFWASSSTAVAMS